MLFNSIGLALMGGILPALVWLWFWRHEDRRHPEPRGRIFMTFIAGMAAVPIAIVLEDLVSPYAGDNILILFLLWAIVEEIMKFIAAYVSALKTRVNNEPIDAVIYMITAALGFAALETTLFILAPFLDGFFLQGFLTSNLRFIGASVLHIIASGVIGAFLGISFYRAQRIKRGYLWIGLICAVVLHTLFNFFIMQSEIFTVFGVTWAFLFLLLLFFEKVKKVRPFKKNK